jgi:hypothetical protein
MRCVFPDAGVLLCGCNGGDAGRMLFTRVELRSEDVVQFSTESTRPDRWHWQASTRALVIERDAGDYGERFEYGDRGEIRSRVRIRLASFSPDGAYYATPDVFEVATRRRVMFAGEEPYPPTWPVHSSWAPTGRWLHRLVENPVDGVQRATVLDMVERTASTVLSCMPGGGGDPSWSADGYRWATTRPCVSPREASVWDHPSHRAVALKPLPFDVDHDAIDPAGRWLVVRGEKQELAIVDLAAGSAAPLDGLAATCDGEPSWSPSGRSIACVTREGDVLLIDAASRAERHLGSGEHTCPLVFSPDGALLALPNAGSVHILRTDGTGRVL